MKEFSAGGAVFRKVREQTEILLILDRFGRTTLPKGHLEEGETMKQAALREVEEETGIQAQIVGEPLGIVTYRFDVPGKGAVEKEVTYYLMKAETGVTKAQIKEIREAIWYPLEQVRQVHAKSGYDNNNMIIDRVVERLKGEANA